MVRRESSACAGQIAIMPDPHSKSPPTSSASQFPPPPDLVAPLRPPSAPRYSLRTLLIVMTVVAVGVVLAGVYGRFSLWLLTAVVFFGGTIVCFTAAIYCRGGRQAFFIGAACIAFLNALNSPPVARGWAEFLLLAAGQVIAMALAGGIAVFTRRFIEKRGWNAPPRNPRGNIGE